VAVSRCCCCFPFFLILLVVVCCTQERERERRRGPIPAAAAFSSFSFGDINASNVSISFSWAAARERNESETPLIHRMAERWERFEETAVVAVDGRSRSRSRKHTDAGTRESCEAGGERERISHQKLIPERRKTFSRSPSLCSHSMSIPFVHKPAIFAALLMKQQK